MTLTNALAWTLIHFLWQGAVIAGLLAGSLAFLKNAGSRIRYGAGCATMMLMLISALLTFAGLQISDEPVLSISTVWTAPLAAGSDLSFAVPATFSPSRNVVAYFPALLWMWFTGVVGFSIRSLGGWVVAERYARRQTS